MKVLKLLVLSSMIATSGAAMANDGVVDNGYVFDKSQLIPTGVRAEFGMAGGGAALLWTASPNVKLALGWNGGDISWTDDVSINGTKYDLDMDNNLAYLNAEIYPWGASTNRWIQGLYVAAGVAYVDNKYDLTKKSSDGTVRVNGNNYAFDGRIDGQMDYKNSIAPYLGLGWAPKITKNWGVFGEVGAYWTGNPEVDLSAQGTFVNAQGANFAQDLKAEEHQIANRDKFEWLPMAKVGVSYNW